jgi:DNA repair ATPase RecN
MSVWKATLGLALLITVGCAKPPTAELQAAQDALVAAREAGAVDYEISQYDGAQTAIESAKTAIANGEFESAREFIQEASLLAQEAAAGVEPAKEAVRASVSTTLDDFREVLEGLDGMLADLEACPKRKMEAVEFDLEVARSHYEAASTRLAEVEASLATAEPLEALQAAEQARDELRTEAAAAEAAKAESGC